jgi:hypothetical protein
VEEPKINATQEDFLMDEMVAMAIDFQEENLFKKVLSMKIAKEAVIKFH